VGLAWWAVVLTALCNPVSPPIATGKQQATTTTTTTTTTTKALSFNSQDLTMSLEVEFFDTKRNVPASLLEAQRSQDHEMVSPRA